MSRHTHTPPDIGFELSRVALVLSIILVFFAWNIPVIADTFRPVAQSMADNIKAMALT